MVLTGDRNGSKFVSSMILARIVYVHTMHNQMHIPWQKIVSKPYIHV